MEIRDFKHDSNNGIIEFVVDHNGEMNKVEIESTGCGTEYTDINDFTDDWTDAEYNQLEGFIDGCSGMLHQFYHS